MTPEQWGRIQELFLVALEREPESRDTWLAGQTTDPQVLTDVRALLRADAADSDHRIRDPIAATAESLQLAGSGAPSAGARVGPYRLEREIGHGGMGAVWLAVRADDAYHAQVAIKFVRHRFASPGLASRLLAERQILANLTHPNIAWLLDGGATDDGTPYLVMEYIDGETVDRWCDDASLGLTARVALFTTVCEAVRYAHAGLVIHRDIKPSNILVNRDGIPKLVDFGTAKLLVGDATPSVTATLPFLTPAYAAPEQLLGERITVTTDVYALGGVLYRMVTGAPPHDVAGVSAAEMERRICDQEPRLPSAVAREAGLPWARRLVGDLDTIILTALHKDPARRYQSVDRLTDDLRRHAEGRPVLARPDSWSYRAGRFLRRHRTGVALAAIAVLLSAFSLGYHARRITTERNLARIEAAKAREVTAFLRSLFEVSDPTVSLGETVTARELLDAGADRVRTTLASQPVVQATLMRTIGEVYQSLGLRDKAGPLIDEAYRQHLALLGARDDETIASAIAWAVWLQNAGRVEEAIPFFRDAATITRELHGDMDGRTAVAANHLASALHVAGDYVGAEAEFRRAIAVSRQAVPFDSALHAANVGRLGRLLRQIDRPEEAEELLREALSVQRALYGTLHPDVASTARNLGALLRTLGRYEEADTLFREALATRRTLFGDEHRDVTVTLNSYAGLLDRWGKRDSAIVVATDVVARMEREHRGRPHPDVVAALTNLAELLRDAGRLDEARARLERAVTMSDEAYPDRHPFLAFPLSALGDVLLRQGAPDSALVLFQRALALRRAALPAGHHLIAESDAEVRRARAALDSMGQGGG